MKTVSWKKENESLRHIFFSFSLSLNREYWLIISPSCSDKRRPWGWSGPLWVWLSGSSYSLISPPPLTRSYHFAPHLPPLQWRGGNSAPIRLFVICSMSLLTRGRWLVTTPARRLIEGDIKNSLLSKRISVLYFYPPTPNTPHPFLHSSVLPFAPLPGFLAVHEGFHWGGGCSLMARYV